MTIEEMIDNMLHLSALLAVANVNALDRDDVEEAEDKLDEARDALVKALTDKGVI